MQAEQTALRGAGVGGIDKHERGRKSKSFQAEGAKSTPHRHAQSRAAGRLRLREQAGPGREAEWLAEQEGRGCGACWEPGLPLPPRREEPALV